MSQDRTTATTPGTDDDAGSREAVTRVLADITGLPPNDCARRTATLTHDLGVDSLALLEVVETLQAHLGIVVADEVTARIRTVAD